MTDHGFRGIDADVVRMLSKGFFDRSGLKEVVVMCAGSVCIDIGQLCFINGNFDTSFIEKKFQMEKE